MCLLADGPVDNKRVKAKAREQGISDYELRRARTSLQIKTDRKGKGTDHECMWKLPDQERAR